jgi:hypothetical protein
MDGACGTLGRDEKCMMDFSQKTEEMRPVGISRHTGYKRKIWIL